MPSPAFTSSKTVVLAGLFGEGKYENAFTLPSPRDEVGQNVTSLLWPVQVRRGKYRVAALGI